MARSPKNVYVVMTEDGELYLLSTAKEAKQLLLEEGIEGTITKYTKAEAK